MSPVRPLQLERTANSLKHDPSIFQGSSQLRHAFEDTHRQIWQIASEANRKNVDLVIGLARMQRILSERGEEHRRMLNEAGIGHWTWIAYFAWFKREFKYELTLRTVQRNIAKLVGKGICLECQKANGHSPECSKFKPTRVVQLQSRLAAIKKAAQELTTACERHLDLEQAVGKFLNAIGATEASPNSTVDRQEARVTDDSAEIVKLGIQLAEHVVRNQLQAAREIAMGLLTRVHKNSDCVPDPSDNRCAVT